MLAAAASGSSASYTIYIWIAIAVGGLGILTQAWRVWNHSVRPRLEALDTVTGLPSEGGRPAIEALPFVVAKHGEQLDSLQAGQKAMVAQVQGISNQVTEIAKEVKVNGGSSLHDDVRRVETTVSNIDQRLTEEIKKSDARHQENTARLDAVDLRLGNIEQQGTAAE